MDGAHKEITRFKDILVSYLNIHKRNKGNASGVNGQWSRNDQNVRPFDCHTSTINQISLMFDSLI